MTIQLILNIIKNVHLKISIHYIKNNVVKTIRVMRYYF